MKNALPLLLALALCACRGPSTPFPSSDVPGLAPIPYTVEQLRSNHPSGVHVDMQTLVGGVVTESSRTEFLDSDALAVTLRMTRYDGAGAALGQPVEQRVTWVDLRGHAHFPAAATQLGHAVVRVPAGEYEAWVYSVHAGDEAGTVTTYHFAVDEPGPPVLLVQTVGGAEVLRMQMVADGR
jgi:hypothetical protein